MTQLICRVSVPSLCLPGNYPRPANYGGAPNYSGPGPQGMANSLGMNAGSPMHGQGPGQHCGTVPPGRGPGPGQTAAGGRPYPGGTSANNMAPTSPSIPQSVGPGMGPGMGPPMPGAGRKAQEPGAPGGMQGSPSVGQTR